MAQRLSVRPSVCLSLSCMRSIETAEHVMQSTPYSLGTLVFWCQRSWSWRNIREGC